MGSCGKTFLSNQNQWPTPRSRSSSTINLVKVVRSPLCGSGGGPGDPRPVKERRDPFVSAVVRGQWAALCLFPPLRPGCHSWPYPGYKALDNWAPGIIGHAKPLRHGKVVAQGGVPLSHCPEPLPSTNIMYRKTTLKISHGRETQATFNTFPKFYLQNLVTVEFVPIRCLTQTQGYTAEYAVLTSSGLIHSFDTFAGGRIAQERVGGDGPCIAQRLSQTVQTQVREGVGR